MILVAVSYSNNFLTSRMASNEFSANKQFMLTTGLQIDDIAWTVGRTQTIRYSSQYGNMKFQTLALNYTFDIDTGSGFQPWFSTTTGMILFNMPISMYSMGNNYFERVSSTKSSFFLEGPSAPVTYVYCIEKLPMSEGNYTRIVAVPSIRIMNTAIGSTNYCKLYLPTLVPALSNPHLSQSVTLTGTDIMKQVKSGVKQVRITTSFPNGGPSSLGFDSSFFKFEQTTITLNSTTTPKITSDSVVEFYIGKITVALGQV
jgi:hypothetical protein